MIDVPKDNTFAAETVVYWQNRCFVLEDKLNKAADRIEEQEAQLDAVREWYRLHRHVINNDLDISTLAMDADAKLTTILDKP